MNTQLHTVLSVLKGLQEATLPFENGSVPTRWVNYLADNLGDPLAAHLSTSDKRIRVQGAIERLHKDAIYSGNLDIEAAEAGYENARQAWLQTLKIPYGPVEKHKDPIPSLLIQRDWSRDAPLARAFAETWKPEVPPVAAWRQVNKEEPVVAVADTWRDHDLAIEKVTQSWLSNNTSKAKLKQLICDPLGAQTAVLEMPSVQETPGESLENEQYSPPTVIVALALCSLLVVECIAIFLGGQLKAAVPAILAMILLIVTATALVSYWNPRLHTRAFLWVASAIYLGQMSLTVMICRDVLIKDTTKRWVQPVEILFFVSTIVLEVLRKHLEHTAKEPSRDLHPKRRAS